MTVPNWLAKRGGTLTPGVEGSLFVVFDGQPHYRLDLVPAAGRIACVVTQTVNGSRIEDAATFPDEPTALSGGLERLRRALGW